jgi:hypothetical protein
MMIILNCDGTLVSNGLRERATERIKEIIEVPSGLAMQQSDLIDRIIAFAFDGLGLQAIEVRVRPSLLAGHEELSCASPCL